MVDETVSTNTVTATVVEKKECYDVHDDDFATRIPANDDDDNDNVDVGTIGTEAVETRLDICASLFAPMSDSEKQAYINALVHNYKENTNVTTIHISGQQLHTVLTTEQICTIMKSIKQLTNITEYFCFHGGCETLTSDLLAKSLPPNLHILIVWHFPSLSSNAFAAALRLQSSLQRLTLNFACGSKQQQQQQNLSWGCLDVVVMACACMERLQVLQMRCVPRTSDHHIAAKVLLQQEAIISPEAMVVLLNSPTVKQLYLENCGLIDDHMDEVYNELPKNKALTMLDLKGNMFSDDCLYTMSRLLPIAPHQLHYLDISGVSINEEAGKAVALGMIQNCTLQSLEIEGTIQRFQDEFDIPVGHNDTDWMQLISHQLRLNRAYQVAYNASSRSLLSNNHNTERSSTEGATFVEKQNVISKDMTAFVVAVSSVSDSASCMYHFLRTYPDHCNRLTAPVPHVEPHTHNNVEEMNKSKYSIPS